jgi:4-nitrophenyl phosphatase
MQPDTCRPSHQDEIFGSAYASVAYLKYNLNFPKDKKVYILGERGLEEELELEGIHYAGGTVGLQSVRK